MKLWNKNTSQKNTLSRRLSLGGMERLEDRRVLAGTVQVVISGADILLFGDGAGNTVDIETSGPLVTIDGFFTDLTDSNGVAIPGDTITANLSGDLIIDLDGGDDDVYFYPGSADFAGSFSFDGGSGNDRLLTGLGTPPFSTGGDFTFIGGGGNDVVDVDNLTVGGDLDIRGNGGNDSVVLDDVTVLGETTIDMGNQDDYLDIDDSNFYDDVDIIGGGGNDNLRLDDQGGGSPDLIIGNLDIDAGSGNDDVYLDGSVQIGGKTVIDLGTGNDDLDVIEGAYFGGDVRILGRSGADSISLDEGIFISGDLFINSGGGSDFVNVGTLGTAYTPDLIVTGDLTIRTGGGHDDVYLNDVSIFGDTDVKTGGGNDLFDIDYSDFGGLVEVRLGNGNDTVDDIRFSDFFTSAFIFGGNGFDVVTGTVAANTGPLVIAEFFP